MQTVLTRPARRNTPLLRQPLWLIPPRSDTCPRPTVSHLSDPTRTPAQNWHTRPATWHHATSHPHLSQPRPHQHFDRHPSPHPTPTPTAPTLACDIHLTPPNQPTRRHPLSPIPPTRPPLPPPPEPPSHHRARQRTSRASHPAASTPRPDPPTHSPVTSLPPPHPTCRLHPGTSHPRHTPAAVSPPRLRIRAFHPSSPLAAPSPSTHRHATPPHLPPHPPRHATPPPSTPSPGMPHHHFSHRPTPPPAS